MAQIHALLYAENDPLDTDSIMQKMSISRGNANINLRNLLQWELIQKVHYPGVRLDFFTAEKDVWNVVCALIKERHQREENLIRECMTETLSIFDNYEV